MHITRVAVCLIVLPKIYYLAAELLMRVANIFCFIKKHIVMLSFFLPVILVTPALKGVDAMVFFLDFVLVASALKCVDAPVFLLVICPSYPCPKGC